MMYTLLDDQMQSDACFIKQTALDKLDIEGFEVNLKLSTVLAEEEITSQKINGLVVRGVNEGTEISLPCTYSRDIIPAKQSQIPRPETACKWLHLKRIADYLMPYNDNLSVCCLELIVHVPLSQEKSFQEMMMILMRRERLLVGE